MSDEKYKQEARNSWQEIASIAESVPESASYVHGFIDGIKIGNKELEHKLEMAKESTEKLTKLLLLTIDIVNCEIGADYDRWMREVEQLK